MEPAKGLDTHEPLPLVRAALTFRDGIRVDRDGVRCRCQPSGDFLVMPSGTHRRVYLARQGTGTRSSRHD
jgi:hypothetical protein